MFEKRKDRQPLVRVWSGTPVHASIDTRMHMRLVEKLKASGIKSHWQGDYSILDVFEKDGKTKRAIVTHHARGSYRYNYTPAQTDAEAIIIDMHSGKLPEGIKMFVTAHKHTTDGTIVHRGLRIIRSPAFVTFIPYKGSLTMLPHFIPDIGAWIVIITKDGRILLQEWLYKPFMYEENNKKIIQSEYNGKGYVHLDDKTIHEPLQSLLKDAQKVIMIMADLHVGELQSVAPKSFTDVNGIIHNIDINIANEKLYTYWQHLCYMTKKFFKPDEIWLVGDLFAGQMPAKFEKFRKITIGNLDDQCDACHSLLMEMLGE